jgi:hypothetical protein
VRHNTGSIKNPSSTDSKSASRRAQFQPWIFPTALSGHHADVSWNETWTGTDQVRNYAFEGDRLMLATAPSPNPFTGKMSIRTLTWEKIK